jgi:hypothetical protein
MTMAPAARGDIGISHVPIAVADLERAAADFRRLGFSLKEGRPHPNGIRNRHVKFRDGTEIELITAPRATDELTRHYREILRTGDRAAFLSLYPADSDLAARQIEGAGLPVRRGNVYVDFPYSAPLGYVFFAPLNRSPTDRPEHFAHENSAASLVGVRLESASFDAERRLFKALGLGGEPCKDEAAQPRPTCVALSDGGRLILAQNPAVAQTRITRLEVRAASLERTASILTKARVAFERPSPDRISVDDLPLTHGVGLDFSSANSAPFARARTLLAPASSLLTRPACEAESAAAPRACATTRSRADGSRAAPRAR